ncbi:MAG: alpha-galactosidase [Clostridia bacterium]|nr:alpha-galactosidase [Clostridia bacterium]
MIFDINNFTAKIICEEQLTDTKIETVTNGNELQLHISATSDKPKFVELHWTADADDDLLVLGDAWERSYANLQFLPLSESRYMPWYFIATNKRISFCFGVKTGCNSFVSFRYDKTGITALVDLRNGGCGVHLGGRKLHLATFVYASYDNAEIYENLVDYCKRLCTNPILPKERIYGGNNWYYAYGKSKYSQIISDARLQVLLAEGIDNRPFQVIDDCWQKHKCEGPWLPNRKFKDMEKLASEIKEIGARPGIWVRLLHNRDRALKKDMRIKRGRKRQYLDPTHPEVQKYIRADIERIRDWGYELIKHDFSTADLFGDFGGNLNETITKIDGWHFYDKTKTNAEIVLDFYRLILETAGDMLIIGCNTVSHLSAGLVHIYRTGDDTSGREWHRTRDYGVNTLAFRLAQNEVFYMCDADCVGIVKGKIPWSKNRQWLHLLSYSNTPLFVSCTDEIGEEERKDFREAYRVFNEPHTIKPIDIYDTKTPSEWLIDGKLVKYNWRDET